MLVEVAGQRFGLASTESKLKVACGSLAFIADEAFGLNLGFTFGGDSDFDCFHSWFPLSDLDTNTDTAIG